MDFSNVFSLWKNAVLNPKETFAKEKANSSVGIGILYYFVAFLISGLIGMLALFINFGIPITASIIGLVIGAAIIGSILTIFLQGILFITAKLLGGKGTIIQQYYLVSLYAAPLIIISLILNLVPSLGILIGRLIFLYELYLLTLVLTEVHQYGMGRAVLTWLIPLILGAILVFLVIGVAVLAAFGMFAQGSTGLVGLIRLILFSSFFNKH